MTKNQFEEYKNFDEESKSHWLTNDRWIVEQFKPTHFLRTVAPL